MPSPPPNTPDQNSGQPAVARAVPAPSDNALIDWKFGLRLLGRRLYVNLRIGRERRSPLRLEAEGQVRLPVVATAYLTVGSALFSLFGMVCFLYLLKSMAGIHLFRGTSPLHPLYALFFE